MYVFFDIANKSNLRDYSVSLSLSLGYIIGRGRTSLVFPLGWIDFAQQIGANAGAKGREPGLSLNFLVYKTVTSQIYTCRLY